MVRTRKKRNVLTFCIGGKAHKFVSITSRHRIATKRRVPVSKYNAAGRKVRVKRRMFDIGTLMFCTGCRATTFIKTSETT